MGYDFWDALAAFIAMLMLIAGVVVATVLVFAVAGWLG